MMRASAVDVIVAVCEGRILREAGTATRRGGPIISFNRCHRASRSLSGLPGSTKGGTRRSGEIVLRRPPGSSPPGAPVSSPSRLQC